jgi:hypothetical protein
MATAFASNAFTTEPTCIFIWWTERSGSHEFMKCEICGKSPPVDNVTLHRVNPKGTDGIWRCCEHVTPSQAKAIYPNVKELVEIIDPSNTVSGINSEHIWCRFAGLGRGDCEHFVGLPGKSIPGQHDGPDDTVDVYGIPNGWCEYCWSCHKLTIAENKIKELCAMLEEHRQQYANKELEIIELRNRLS